MEKDVRAGIRICKKDVREAGQGSCTSDLPGTMIGRIMSGAMNRIVNQGVDYPSYRGIPPLAGILSMQEAIDPGLNVEECVARLKRYHYSFKRLYEMFMAHIAAEPIYELKMAFSLHAHYCTEHATALRTRVGEMREPPLGLDVVPDKNLEIFFDEILQAPTTGERMAAIYQRALPALLEAMQKHIEDTNRLADHPSFRLCRFASIELQEMIDFGAKAMPGLVDKAAQEKMRLWLDLLDDCLEYPRVPKRDERFVDPYNAGVNAEAFLYDESFKPEPKVLMMFYKRLREIDVPEMMASIIFETKGKPWNYYRDMTRQLWDEARHAMMGEVGFVSVGVDWRKVPILFTWSLGLNTQLTPLERHAVLYFIEQGLMPRTGKRFEWEVGVASQNPMAALFQDYDWADEVLHAQIGRNWYVKEMGDAAKAVAYGDKCWSSVLNSWQKWKDDGLTEHHNWWPEVYAEACKSAGIKPDPRVLAFNTNYNNVRADLKVVSTSG
jgi:hypothetical protein